LRGKLEEERNSAGRLIGWACDMSVQMDCVQLLGYRRERSGERAFLSYQVRHPAAYKRKLRAALTNIIAHAAGGQ
jgi:hypothetical protein